MSNYVGNTYNVTVEAKIMGDTAVATKYTTVKINVAAETGDAAMALALGVCGVSDWTGSTASTGTPSDQLSLFIGTSLATSGITAGSTNVHCVGCVRNEPNEDSVGVHDQGSTVLQVAAPTATPASGASIAKGSDTITLSDATSGATILYKKNSGAEQVYTGPIDTSDWDGSVEIVARAVKSGMQDSDNATFDYTVPQVAAPTATPATGATISIGIDTITLASTTADAVIKYQKDGGTEQTYTGPIDTTGWSGSVEITAKATKAGMTDSTTSTFNYTVEQVAAPTATPASGSSITAGTDTITLESTTSGAAITYQKDGAAAENYSTPIDTTGWTGSVVITAKATKAGMTDSTESTFNYTVA
jgi:hypothetical protein